MRRLHLSGWLLLVVVLSVAAESAAGWVPAGLPPAPPDGPALCPRDYLAPEQGRAVLDAALTAFPDAASWDRYAAHARNRIQEGAGLTPWPRRTPLHPFLHSRREYAGYSVEAVAFESVPGFFATGNLYRPLGRSGRLPAVLSTHGHTSGVSGAGDYDRHGRFHPSAQTRAAMLARQGAVVLAIDMFGYGDSIEQVGQEAHRTPFAMTMQLWNAIRALDYLTSRDDVDPARLAVTGESGGGTQAFLLAALDARVAVSVPVVMVSSYFFGGCPCESGRPIHRSTDHFVSNAMIAALAAPRPQLIVSDGKDWTRHVPEIEFPFLRTLYARCGAIDRVQNVHLPDEGHDYGPSKRAAMYAFLAQQVGLDAFPGGEEAIVVLPAAQLRVFDQQHRLPEHAARDAAAVEQALRALQN
jgi:hypothetical protein